jgi:hypothetical protein
MEQRLVLPHAMGSPPTWVKIERFLERRARDGLVNGGGNPRRIWVTPVEETAGEAP